MINEKELRPGNLYTTIRNQEIVVKGIDTINKFVLVDPIDPSAEGSTKGSNSIIFEDLNPIEINSCKSEKLGFTVDCMTLPVISDHGAKFVWDEEHRQVVFYDGQQGVVGQTLRYIHQFQNLYFSLTGKELIV